MSEFRLQRVQNLVRDQISALIMRGAIKDPRVDSLLSISHVTVSKDIAYADVYISGFVGKRKLEKAVEALNHASGYINHRLRKTLQLRTTPQLRFKIDDAIAEGFEMTQKLKELQT